MDLCVNYLSIPSSLVRLNMLFLAAASCALFWPGEGGTLGVDGAVVGAVNPPDTAVVPTVGLHKGAELKPPPGLIGSSSPL